MSGSRKNWLSVVFIITVVTLGENLFGSAAQATETTNSCVECHLKTTPGIVADWKASRHSQDGIGCESCHGSAHKSATDSSQARIAGPDTCKQCHEQQVTEFMSGKHAMAFSAAFGIPHYPRIPRVMMEGGKACGGCHKIGQKNAEQFARLEQAGMGRQSASCDVCHTRHTFSKAEASQPQACMSCHQGSEHDNYKMYLSSKHGAREMAKQLGVLPKDASAPTCQTCHMPGGNHEVRTAWGIFALRTPLSDDPKWRADQMTILQALGALDQNGNPTRMAAGMKSLDAWRTTKGDWQRERGKMIQTCSECHTASFVKAELAKDDNLIREGDALMAEAIRIVAGLYKDGTVAKPESYPAPFPRLLTYKDAPNPAEDKLFEMFLAHRSKMFVGGFHNDPESVLLGYEACLDDLNEIKGIAAELRREKVQQGEGLQRPH